MTHLLRLATALALALVVGPGAAVADAIEIEDAWSRASIGTARPGVAYMTIRNAGETTRILADLRTEAAARPEIHRTTTDEAGVMRMAPAGAIAIAPGETVALAPGGLHAMLRGLVRPLVEGERFALTLVFADGEPVTVEVPVFGIAARGPEG